MELCSDGHEEVCFEARTCPVCVLMDDYKDQQIEDLEKEIEDLEKEIEELREAVADE